MVFSRMLPIPRLYYMIAIDADLGLIYNCAESYALPLTVENLDCCVGDHAMCVGFVRVRSILKTTCVCVRARACVANITVHADLLTAAQFLYLITGETILQIILL